MTWNVIWRTKILKSGGRNIKIHTGGKITSDYISFRDGKNLTPLTGILSNTLHIFSEKLNYVQVIGRFRAISTKCLNSQIQKKYNKLIFILSGKKTWRMTPKHRRKRNGVTRRHRGCTLPVPICYDKCEFVFKRNRVMEAIVILLSLFLGWDEEQ